MASFNATPFLETLLTGRDLSSEAAASLMEAIIAGQIPAPSVAAIAIALRCKGESVAELAAFASVMREKSIAVQAPPGTLDTCGTGGDKSHTFNISTTTALVVAGIGIPVAKHGGRSITSNSGSAEVLKTLGVNIEAPPACVERCIEAAGIGFLFAPAHHPGMREVAAVRKELGVRTIFNLLGPLTNPARARFQLLGVFEPILCEKFANVLKQLGSESAMIVCGAGPNSGGFLDEFSTFGSSTFAWLKNGSITVDQIHPSNFGIQTCDATALFASSADSSAGMIRSILEGQKGPTRDIVVLNSAAAAMVSGKAANWLDGIDLAQASIDTGRAKLALTKLIAISNM